jgi:hypothetical protein
MNDDNLVATIVSECLHVMRGYDTRTKMTACYNLTSAILDLFCVQGDKNDVITLMDLFNTELKKQIEENYL